MPKKGSLNDPKGNCWVCPVKRYAGVSCLKAGQLKTEQPENPLKSSENLKTTDIKKVFIFVMPLLLVLLCSAMPSFTTPKTSVLKPSKKHLSGNLNLGGGCSIHYEVDVEYTIIPPKIVSYHGTLTFSGNCTGSQTFRGNPDCDANGNITELNLDESEYTFTQEIKESMKIELEKAY